MIFRLFFFVGGFGFREGNWGADWEFQLQGVGGFGLLGFLRRRLRGKGFSFLFLFLLGTQLAQVCPLSVSEKCRFLYSLERLRIFINLCLWSLYFCCFDELT